MDVAIIAAANHPIREPFAGGMERHTWQLARGLTDRGHHVTVHAGEDSVADGFEVRSIGPTDDLRLSETARQDVSMFSERFLRQHHAYLDLLLSLQDSDVDVVHNNSLHHLPVAMGATLPAPMTMTLHCPPTPWLESAFRLARRPPRCVAVSGDTAHRWQGTVAADVVLNAVDTTAWPLGPGGSGRAVWTGRIVPEKGPHLALEAAALAGIPLDVAGPVGDRGYLEREVLPRMRREDDLVGHLAGDALAELVGRAEVQLVTPRWDEPYGLVVPEALASGTPVAAFDRGAMAELLDDTSGRLAPADDVVALAAAVAEARTLDRRACRARVEAIASLDRMLDGYERIFAEVAA